MIRVGGEWAWATAYSGLSPPPPLHKPPCETVSLSVRVSSSGSLGWLAEMPSLGLVMENGQVLPAFLFCSTLLVIKMYAVAVITGHTRLRKKVSLLVGGGAGGEGDQPSADFFLQGTLRTEKQLSRCVCQLAVGAASRLPPPQPLWKLAWPSAPEPSWYESPRGFPCEGLLQRQFPGRQAGRFHIWVEWEPANRSLTSLSVEIPTPHGRHLHSWHPLALRDHRHSLVRVPAKKPTRNWWEWPGLPDPFQGSIGSG